MVNGQASGSIPRRNHSPFTIHYSRRSGFGQHDRHRRAVLGGALEGDRPAVLLDDALTEGEPDAGAPGLGGEEDLEHARQHLGGEGGAAVVKAAAPGAAGQHGGGEREIAAFGGGGGGVDEQVDADLRELPRVDGAAGGWLGAHALQQERAAL